MAIAMRRTRSILAVLLAVTLTACGGDHSAPVGPGSGTGSNDGTDAGTNTGTDDGNSNGTNTGTDGGTDGGSPGTTPTPPTLASLSMGSGKTYAQVGVAQRLKVTGHYSDGSTADLTQDIRWASSNAAVATVDATGLLTPWTSGCATITATHGPTGRAAETALTARFVVPLAAGTGLPALEVVDTTAAFFRVSGLTPGAMYRPTVSGMTDDVDLAVYSDASLTDEAQLCDSARYQKSDESCVAPANGAGELYLVVDGEWTQSGAQFTVDVPAAAEMELAGQLAFPAALPYAGSVGATQQTWQVTGLTPGATYEVRISNLTADIDVWVYGDAYGYALSCESYRDGTADDFCLARASATGSLFVDLDGETTPSGGAYTLTLTAL